MENISGAGSRILNEILGLENNYDGLSEKIILVTENNERIDEIGICGESPIHICLYKRDIKMLRILLSGKYDPNTVNSYGETIFHIAAKLGIPFSIIFIKLAYLSKKS